MNAELNNFIGKIREDVKLTFDESFLFTKLISEVANGTDRNLGRDIVIESIDKISLFHKSTWDIWNDLLSSYGLYPYMNKNLTGGSNQLRYEYHRSQNLENIFFHSEQKEIADQLLSKNSVVLSAPTSFGKSLLIHEVIASKIYKNIVIVQPTLALIDETRKKVSKYSDVYNIIVTTKQNMDEVKGNIFIYTAERVVEYQKFEAIDFFVIDEFYKLSLSRDDDRAITLNRAFYKLLKLTRKFYMLGPMIKSIPIEFQQNFQFNWYHTNFKTVIVEEVNVPVKRSTKVNERKKILYDLLSNTSDPTLIYCSSPQRATDLASEFSKYIASESSNEQANKDIVEWINENIHNKWSLTDCLLNKIGFHHGAIPRHLGSSLVDAFNCGDITYLFCTSTLIEGVNTSAKNIVLFDKKKGRKDLDYFDFKNICGRSGRMKQFYKGFVYNFHNEPAQLELDVDIPIITQDDAPIELLICIDEVELKENSKKKLSEFEKQPEELQLLLRQNSGVKIEKQIRLYEELKKDIDKHRSVLLWNGYPTYDQLNGCCELCWNYLLDPQESKAYVSSPAQLAVLVMKYMTYKSIYGIIRDQITSEYWLGKESDDQKRVDIVSFRVMNAARLWFDFKFPKLLTTLSTIQKFMFSEIEEDGGDYRFIASQIENGFVSDDYQELVEYDIPRSAIRKIDNFFPEKISTDKLKEFLKLESLDVFGFNDYERKKVKKFG